MADLAKATDTRAGQAENGLRSAQVSQVLSAGSVMLTVNGAEIGPVAVLSSYYPVVGDTVAVFRQEASWLVLGATNRDTQFSRYSGGAASLAGNAWNVLTLPSYIEGPVIPNDGAGLFTLDKAGVWTIGFGIHMSPGASTGIFAGLFSDVARSVIYADGFSPAAANLQAVTVSADVVSNGSTTVTAQVFPVTANSTIVAGNGYPRVTFRLNP